MHRWGSAAGIRRAPACRSASSSITKTFVKRIEKLSHDQRAAHNRVVETLNFASRYGIRDISITLGSRDFESWESWGAKRESSTDWPWGLAADVNPAMRPLHRPV
jgi:hypothetical protein